MGGRQDAASLRLSTMGEEALQLSWGNKINQSARIPPTSLWSPRLNPLIPREKGEGEGEGKVGGGQLIHVKQ